MQTEEQLKKRVGAKLEVAKFLQDTVSEMANDMRSSKTGAAQASAADLYQFMKRVGPPLSTSLHPSAGQERASGRPLCCMAPCHMTYRSACAGFSQMHVPVN